MDAGDIEIAPGLAIPFTELEFIASPSSGPGGQNVNRVATRVTLRFDVAASPSLDDDQRARLRTELATRINRHGVLAVTSQKHRTQAANRRAALERFRELVAAALTPATPRRPTRPSRGARTRRLEEKRRRSRRKAERRTPERDD